MNSSEKIIFLSAGLIEPKKSRILYSTEHLYLNYGLLGLASILYQRGIDVHVTHGNFTEPKEKLFELVNLNLLPSKYPVMLSIPSSYAIPWARFFCEELKSIYPKTKIIVGGRWVVADDPQWIKDQIPHVDLVVEGTAENKIEKILGLVPSHNYEVMLNYAILDNFLHYNPSVEISRGCGMKCVFCAEANEPLGSLKNVDKLTTEISSIFETYNSQNLNFYFESSFFRPNKDWILDLIRFIEIKKLKLNWRTETRADALSPKHVELLSKTGLKIIDIGLESASLQQIRNMKKSTEPLKYLERASNLLRSCYENNIWTKVNLLLYPGETEITINETLEWLSKHQKYIKGVSVGPVILFRYGIHSNELLKYYNSLGAFEVNPTDLNSKGYAYLHLSPHINYEKSIELSESISNQFMSQENYFELKKFSYLSRLNQSVKLL